jgi:hypothetical protein
MFTQLVIGYDPGFGNTKICVNGQINMLQSAVARPKAVGLATIGMRSAGSHVPTVTFDGHTFVVGPGSWNKGEPLTSMDYSSLVSPERLALFYAALNGALPDQADLPATLVIGLPVPLLQDQAQATLVLESLKRFKGQHAFQINTASRTLVIHRIKVVAQPVGAYVDWLYDESFVPRAGGGKAEVAVVDIGMNTLDLYVIASGQVLERHIGGAEVGVRRLLELLASNGHDLVELDADLRRGVLRPEAGQLEIWLGEILAAIKRTWPTLKRFSAVIPTGGGALVLSDKLKLALAAKGAAVHWPTDPLAANVRGFWKYGLKHGNSR